MSNGADTTTPPGAPVGVVPQGAPVGVATTPPPAAALAKGGKKTSFLIGLAVGGALVAVAPRLGTWLRPLTRKSIEGGILLSRKLKTMAAEAREDIEDLTAEAMAEVQRAEQEGAPTDPRPGTGLGL